MKNDFFYKAIDSDFNKEKNRTIILDAIEGKDLKHSVKSKKKSLSLTIGPTVIAAICFIAIFNSNSILTHDDIIFNQVPKNQIVQSDTSLEIDIKKDNDNKIENKDSKDRDKDKDKYVSEAKPKPDAKTEKTDLPQSKPLEPKDSEKDNTVTELPRNNEVDTPEKTDNTNSPGNIAPYSLKPSRLDVILGKLTLPDTYTCNDITRDETRFTINCKPKKTIDEEDSNKNIITIIFSEGEIKTLMAETEKSKLKISKIDNVDITILQCKDEIHCYFNYEGYYYYVKSIGVENKDFTNTIKSLLN